MTLRSLLSVLLLSAATFAPQIARAQFGLSSSSSSNANGAVTTLLGLSALQGVTAILDSSVRSAVWSAITSAFSMRQATGSASGIANYGSLHAWSGGGGEGGGGSGSDTSRWFDTVTITSPTLPLGSPVTLLATVTVQRGMLSALISRSGTCRRKRVSGRRAGHRYLQIRHWRRSHCLIQPSVLMCRISPVAVFGNATSLPINQTITAD